LVGSRKVLLRTPAGREFDVLKSFIAAFDETNRYGVTLAERVETSISDCRCGRQREVLSYQCDPT